LGALTQKTNLAILLVDLSKPLLCLKKVKWRRLKQRLIFAYSVTASSTTSSFFDINLSCSSFCNFFSKAIAWSKTP
jgi:hypothetical protein